MVDTTSGRLDRRVLAIAVVVSLTQFMQMLDAAIINVAIPPMAIQFGVVPVEVGLGITAYVVASSIMIPVSSWLADRIGARTLFVAAIAAFSVTSLLCGASRQLWPFVAARMLQGVAGGLMVPVGQIILMRSIERRQVLRIVNITSAPMLLAPVIGPPLGGFITTWFGWPWTFYMNLPVGLLGIVLALRTIPDLRGGRRPFDTAGLMLNVAALAPLLWGLQALGADNVPGAAAGAAIAFGAAIGAVAIRHARRAAHPLIDLAPIRHLTFRLTTISATIFIRLSISALVFVLPILLQVGYGLTAFAAGLLFLAHSTGDLAMKLFTTRVFARFGYRTTLIVATASLAVLIATTALFTPATLIGGVLLGVSLFLGGCFRSFVMTGLTSLAYSDVEPAEVPSATTLTQIVMQLTTAFSVSLATACSGLIDLLRGGAAGVDAAATSRLTLGVMAAVSLCALPRLWRLPDDASRELSGHRRVAPAVAVASGAADGA